MVKIRLARFGSKKNPHYRVVVADSRSPRDGRSIETLGRYNPQTNPSTIEINAERAAYWLGVGAQPTGTAARILKIAGVEGAGTATGEAATATDAGAKKPTKASA